MPWGLLALQLTFAAPFVVWAVHRLRPTVRARATDEFIAGLTVPVTPDLRHRLERRVTTRGVLQVAAMGATIVILVTIQWFVAGEVFLFAYLAVTAAGAFGRMTPAVTRPALPRSRVRVATARPLGPRDVVAPLWVVASVVALLAFAAVDRRLQILRPDPDPWVEVSSSTRTLIMVLVPLAIGLLCVPLVMRAVRGSGPAADEAELAAVVAFRRLAVTDVFAAASALVAWTLITFADSTLVVPWEWTADGWSLQAASVTLWIFVWVAIGAVASPASGQRLLRRSERRPPAAGLWVDTPDFPEIKDRSA